MSPNPNTKPQAYPENEEDIKLHQDLQELYNLLTQLEKILCQCASQRATAEFELGKINACDNLTKKQRQQAQVWVNQLEENEALKTLMQPHLSELREAVQKAEEEFKGEISLFRQQLAKDFELMLLNFQLATHIPILNNKMNTTTMETSSP